jgi:hypothetical protein
VFVKFCGNVFFCAVLCLLCSGWSLVVVVFCCGCVSVFSSEEQALDLYETPTEPFLFSLCFLYCNILDDD